MCGAQKAQQPRSRCWYLGLAWSQIYSKAKCRVNPQKLDSHIPH
jgi:hypothetical protein